jgi:4-aminobutyrate aminotransferase/(S)-3-amino-2-methylpropionate transaminase
MDRAWPVSAGEAIHTSTFLGHPVGCAMALAQIAEIRRLGLPGRSASLGNFLLGELKKQVKSSKFQISVRGMGLMVGVELLLPENVPAALPTMQAVKDLLRAGFIVLPEGAHGNVVSFTPPLTISRAELVKAVRALARVLR